jgi:hypothetical protein
MHYTGDDYEHFSGTLIETIHQYELEFVAIICDNCPAHVNGVSQLWMLHISRLNYMINLVFTHVLAEPDVRRRIGMLDELITDFRTDGAIIVLGRKSPTLVRMRWVSAVDALDFILRRLDVVNSIRSDPDQDPISDSLKTCYFIFLPLKPRSLRFEARDSKLSDVTRW